MQRDEALELVHEWTKNGNLVKHMLAVEAEMRALARHFGEDEDKWGVVGLLHDADYELFKDDPKKHPSKILVELEGRGVDPEIINAVRAHAWGWREDLPEPKSRLEWAIYTSDELSGLITAVTLVRPDKKLSSVTVDAVLKKWNQKGFAAGAKRENIEYCEPKLGIKREDFVALCLKAMQDIAPELGL